MQLYRSVAKKNDGIDYSSTYTCKVGNDLEKGTAKVMFNNESRVWEKKIVIGNNVNSCFGMFAGSSITRFAKPFSIPNSVTSCEYMFSNCTQFSNSVTIPESVINCHNMFRACIRFNNNIYFKSNGNFRIINLKNFLGEYTGSVNRANIFFNNILDNQFRNMTFNKSVPSWTTMTNGFYNSTYGIYCYNNYEG